MSDVSRFRSALNGFNRTDVVNYVESLSIAQQKQLRQLQEQITQLTADKAALEQEKAVLEEKLTAAEAEREELRQMLEAQTDPAVPEEPETEAEEAPAEEEVSANRMELEAYRRAAETERSAVARARKLQERLSALCDGARSRYQDAGEEIAALSADISSNIERLQESFAEVQLIFDQAEESFEALELPEQD